MDLVTLAAARKYTDNKAFEAGSIVIDTTLSKVGQAADAQKVGNELTTMQNYIQDNCLLNNTDINVDGNDIIVNNGMLRITASNNDFVSMEAIGTVEDENGDSPSVLKFNGDDDSGIVLRNVRLPHEDYDVANKQYVDQNVPHMGPNSNYFYITPEMIAGYDGYFGSADLGEYYYQIDGLIINNPLVDNLIGTVVTEIDEDGEESTVILTAGDISNNLPDFIQLSSPNYDIFIVVTEYDYGEIDDDGNTIYLTPGVWIRTYSSDLPQLKVETPASIPVRLDEKYLPKTVAGKNVEGQSLIINNVSQIAKSGAEIFNHYSLNKAIGTCSHAEGYSTEVTGNYSHAEGSNTKASGQGSHAEGQSTKAGGQASHAEGYNTKATSSYSHAEGYNTEATGTYSHVEGYGTKASAQASHAEGYGTKAGGEASHAGGYNTTVVYSGKGAFAHGYSTKIYNNPNSFSSSYEMLPYLDNNSCTVVWGDGATAFGKNSVACSRGAFAAGELNKVVSIGGAALNTGNSVLAMDCTVTGSGNQAGLTVTTLPTTSTYTIDEQARYLQFSLNDSTQLSDMATRTLYGVLKLYSSTSGTYEDVFIDNLTIISQQGTVLTVQYPENTDLTCLAGWADYSKKKLYIFNNRGFPAGSNWKVAGTYSLVGGYNNISGISPQLVHGYYNTIDYAGNYALMLGNGTSSSRSNALTVSYTGEIETSSNLASGGADYAEYFEWLDKNVDNEDRIGYMVALEGEKIRFATPQDEDILGIISGTAGVIGDNAPWEWKQKYQTDEFGRVIWDYVEEFTEVTDNEGITTKESLGEVAKRRLNPDYDATKTYTPRSQRKEWDIVGLIGKLHIRDDGTCMPGCYVKVGDQPGIATLSIEKTNIRMMKRINENIILAFVK